MLSSFFILYTSKSFSSWSFLFIIRGVNSAISSNKEMWNTRCSRDSLSSYSLKLIGLIFSNISYSLIFLKSNLVLSRFVLMCLRNKYILSPLFSRGLIFRFLLLYYAVFNLKNLIFLDSCFYSPYSLPTRTINC